jgi:hypothetical protein
MSIGDVLSTLGVEDGVLYTQLNGWKDVLVGVAHGLHLVDSTITRQCVYHGLIFRDAQDVGNGQVVNKGACSDIHCV